MANSRLCITAALILLASQISTATTHLRIDFKKADGSAIAVQSIARTKARRLHEDDSDAVCYEGCFAAPVDDLTAQPFSINLTDKAANGAAPMSLLDCYTAAVEANVTFFAIASIFGCYGGNEPLQGWALDSCPLTCDSPGGVCGDVGKASFFTMGMCQYMGGPCAPEESPLSATPPPKAPSPPPPGLPPPKRSSPPPPKPPSVPANTNEELPPPEGVQPDVPYASPPPPPPSGKQYRCKAGVALVGTPLRSLKLNPTHTTAANVAECRSRCSQESACKGFNYKTTGWCYLMSGVPAFSKPYSTAVQACHVV